MNAMRALDARKSVVAFNADLVAMTTLKLADYCRGGRPARVLPGELGFRMPWA